MPKWLRSFINVDTQYTAIRVAYDCVLSNLVLGLAFATRILIYMIHEPEQLADGELLQILVEDFFQYGYILALTTVISFAAFGFYKRRHGITEPWRPYIVFAGTSLAVVLFAMIMFFIAPKPLFSRGVIVITWVYMLLFLAFPRIAKYYMFRKVVFEVDQRKRSRPRNILVIGGAGYIGSQLVRELLAKNYRVRVLDSLMFGDFPLRDIAKKDNLEIITGDFRNVQTLVQAMREMDAVVHLGGIVGDPACSLDDDFTIDVNLTATTLVAEACKIFKIQRFVFASTCSVYGQSTEDCLTETSPLNPISLYAKTKIASERVLLDGVSDLFQPTILRFATLFGLSPRPRFDLVVNLLTGKAFAEKKIHVFGGSQWRPFVHVRDTVKAIVAVLEAPIQKVGGQIFNVGSREMNYQIVDVGRLVAKLIPGTELHIDHSQEDARNYSVSFEKLERTLGIKLSWTLEQGILEIKEAFEKGALNPFNSPEYSNLVQTQTVLSRYINHVEDDVEAGAVSHYKRTSKSLLRQI